MVTSAFRSPPRRACGDEAASSTRAPPSRRRRFVNTARGSEFPEVNLDELADEFFSVRDWEEDFERGTGGGRRLSGFAMETESSRQRGRSVSRKSDDSGSGKSMGDATARRRRSLSVARRHALGDEDIQGSTRLARKSGSQKIKQEKMMAPKTISSNNVLRRSASLRDLHRLHDSYSSQSSSLTDDEAHSVCSIKNNSEKTIKVVYAQDKDDHPSVDGEANGLYQAMRKEVRDAVDDIRIDLEKMQVMVNRRPCVTADVDESLVDSSDVIKAIAEIKRSYASKLEESEKRKQKLLAELAAEEYHEQELTKIVDGLPVTEKKTREEKPSQDGRSNDEPCISDELIQEAEKYLEDFLSNVEDTDFSSFDGERSDVSSTIGGSMKSKECLIHRTFTENHEYLTKGVSTAESDGVVLPWLQWETNNDYSPLSNKKKVMTLTSGNSLNDLQEATSMPGNNSNISPSSYNNWSGSCNSISEIDGNKKKNQSDCARNFISGIPVPKNRCSSFDMSVYTDRMINEDLVLEIYRQRETINSGRLVLCRRSFENYTF